MSFRSFLVLHEHVFYFSPPLFFRDLCCIIFRHVHGFCLFVFLHFPYQEAYAGGKCYQSAKQICYRVGKIKTAVGDKYKGAAYHGHKQCG